jgi:pimeloyl-ACP methyl ester carboxylesterase
MNPAAEHRGDVAGTPVADLEPVHFGRGGAPLFGCYHPPQEPVREGSALVICQPFGQEYIRCHRLLRVLAASLARSGLPVLRFDYYGCGDSHGDGEEATLEQCVEDIGEAVRFVRGRARAPGVDLLGLRFGAGAALRFAAARPGQVGRMVLWDPVVRGEDFLASMRAQSARFAQWMQSVFGRAARPGESDGIRDFIGFRFSEALIGELMALDLLQIAQRPCRRALILDNGEEPAASALHDHLARIGVQSELERRASPRIWLAEPYQGLVPRESLELVARWLLESPG